MKDYLLIIPAYNEEGSLGAVLDQIIEKGYLEEIDVLVINDASSDRTAEVISKRPEIKVVSHAFNLGYGSALQLGYRYAVRNHYKYLLQMDADGQHDVVNIEILKNELNTPDAEGNCPDIVIGSRFQSGSQSFHISGVKKISIKFFRKIIKMATGQTIMDPTSGLQGLNQKAFSFWAGFRNFDNNYPDANMVIQMLLMGYRIREVRSVMHLRTTGTSMHSGIIKPLLYMMMMPLSILSVYVRNRKAEKKKKAQAQKQA